MGDRRKAPQVVDRVCNEVVWWFVSWVAALTQLHLYFRHFTQQLNGSEGCPIEQKTLIKNPKTKPSGSNLIFEPSRDVHALVPPTSGRPTTADVTTDTSRGKVSSPPRVLRSDRLDRLGAQERGSKRSSWRWSWHPQPSKLCLRNVPSAMDPQPGCVEGACEQRSSFFLLVLVLPFGGAGCP